MARMTVYSALIHAVAVVTLLFAARGEAQSVNNTGFSAYHGKLTLKGPQLVNQYGQPVQLMGMSTHGLHWFPNCYNKESIQFLVTSWGINLYRPALYIGEGGYQSNPGLKQTVQNIVQWCKELGIYVMIDWHVLTPGDPNYWLGVSGHANALTFWKDMAQLYKNEKHVLYEIANEPNGVSWETVKRYHDTVIPAIRAIDSQTVILAGTTNWSQDIHLAAQNPVANKYNVMYSFHFYACSHGNLFDRFRQYSKQIPVFITEWVTLTLTPTLTLTLTLTTPLGK
jgi:endoglucanase